MNNVKRKIFSPEEKKAICQEVKNLIETENKGVVEAKEIIAEKYGISSTIIAIWDKDFRKFSVEVKKDWTEEEKKTICQKVVNLIDEGKSPKKAKELVAKEYGINPNTISVWDSEYRIFSSVGVKRDWTEKEKKAICQEVKSLIHEGKSANKALELVAKEYGINPGTITVWDRKYRIFSSEFDGNTYTEQEKRDICYKVKFRMEATGCSAMQAIADILSEVNKSDVLEQYYISKSKINDVYAWNREFKYIFEVKDMGPTSKYSINKQIEILEEVNDGKKVSEVAKEHNLTVNTLRRWNKKLKVLKTRKQILDEGIQKLEQKIAEENIQKVKTDIITSKQNEGR